MLCSPEAPTHVNLFGLVLLTMSMKKQNGPGYGPVHAASHLAAAHMATG